MLGRRPSLRACLIAAALLPAACTTTVDSIGYNGVGGVHLRPLPDHPPPPNKLREAGKTDADIASKIAAIFNSLFYGDPNTQAIYFPMGSDQANIQDILHNREVRTEGIGLGMMIAVELDKRTEFDRLWTYANNVLRYKDPPSAGYFPSSCDTMMATEPCDDPYGMQQMLMALIFAHDRWRSDSGPVDYEAGAVALLDVMRHKQDQNGGIVDGVTDVFDPDSALPFTVPTADAATDRVGRPSIVMPAYYDLWALATGDAFWSRAAASARAFLKASAHPTTGLTPVRATFDGKPVMGSDAFLPESYRAQINMTLDEIWSGVDPWNVQEANRLLAFFSGQGIDFYGTSYTLAGVPLNALRDNALVAVNGVTAAIATNPNWSAYVEEAWNLMTPMGMVRYYDGILELTGLLIMSGQYRVW